ncbi:flagellar biosynthesis/type III secretory pathway protein FliH [Scopulibacillus daqui]|uniref:Flagellar biosynthesis/type III secretory pathway protein FliH n=1 Tax=Scopulibacillus daqui TaxID=1469162 RepID=A0ABS2Q1W8_9BACL|nr:hypothetical protein [Scopulibacillus daqui]MBM7646278.1 flagellar biosynthesis/type III secretory pathway protein FliH [Scopulibacillus daqui]
MTKKKKKLDLKLKKMSTEEKIRAFMEKSKVDVHAQAIILNALTNAYKEGYYKGYKQGLLERDRLIKERKQDQ